MHVIAHNQMYFFLPLHSLADTQLDGRCSERWACVLVACVSKVWYMLMLLKVLLLMN